MFNHRIREVLREHLEGLFLGESSFELIDADKNLFSHIKIKLNTKIMRNVRFELTTFRLWDWRAANCANPAHIPSPHNLSFKNMFISLADRAQLSHRSEEEEEMEDSVEI